MEPVFLCKVLSKKGSFINALLNTAGVTDITTEPQLDAKSLPMVAIIFGKIGC